MNKAALDKLQEWSEKGHRSAQADTLLMLAADYPEMVALSADLTPTARLVEFKDTYPDRFFDVGIAEQNLIDFSAGLALRATPLCRGPGGDGADASGRADACRHRLHESERDGHRD